MKPLFFSRFKIGRMNQRNLYWVVALFTTVLGIPSVGRAQTTKETGPTSPPVPSPDVMKVGEYQSPAEKLASDAPVMTEIHTHTVAGRQAATLYIRNIPVLTFVSLEPLATTETKVGVIGNVDRTQSNRSIVSSPTKVATIGASAKNDPIQRATVVAARVNQLIWDKVDASKITVNWFAGGESKAATLAEKNNRTEQGSPSDRYMIKVNGEELVEINKNTRLADTTNDLARDALVAANRMRRLMGKASPLTEIADLPVRSPLSIPLVPMPKLPKQISIGAVRVAFKGVASWYGYDGSGNRTATGERFNPEGLTAAHRSLPFGTRVRVTNTRNGRSVVVRINDRGPFIRGRIIDLSAGAARFLGMMGSGVAPVRVEVLGR